MLSPQKKTIIIPNGDISNGDIVNYTREGMIRVDMTIGISYDSDIKKAKELLMAFMEKDERVLNLINSCVCFCSDRGVKACRCILILQ